MAYKIYFLGGDLSVAERIHFFNPYKERLERLVPARAGTTPIVFEPIDKCSRAGLFAILTDPATVGVIWLSHGTGSGGLRTKEASGDDAPSLYVNPIWLDQELRQAGRTISPNIQFLALWSCHSSAYRSEWQRLLPSRALLKDNEGMLFAASSLPIKDDVTKWLDNRSPKKPEAGASSMLAYAAVRLSTSAPSPTAPPPRPRGGPADWRWVKGRNGRWEMQRIPQEGPPAPIRQSRVALDQSAARLRGFDTRLYDRSLALGAQTRISRVGLNPNLEARISAAGAYAGGLSEPPSYASALDHLRRRLGGFDTSLVSERARRIGAAKAASDAALGISRMSLLNQAATRLRGFDTRLYDRSLALGAQSRISRIGLDPNLEARISAAGAYAGGLSEPPSYASALDHLRRRLGGFDTSLGSEGARRTGGGRSASEAALGISRTSLLDQPAARLRGFDTRLYDRSLALGAQSRISRVSLDPNLGARISAAGGYAGGLSEPPSYAAALDQLRRRLGGFNTSLR